MGFKMLSFGFLKFRHFLILALLFVSGSSHAVLSAYRSPQETSFEAWFRQKSLVRLSETNNKEQTLDEIFARIQQQKPETPYEVRVSSDKLNFDTLPILESETDLQKMFSFVRDTQFIKIKDMQKPRRITWLYPDDGCFARAELMSKYIIENFKIDPKKIYAFGDLEAKTPNHPNGRITWWYHVAVAVRYHNDVVIFDPSLDPDKEMSLSEWQQAIGAAQTTVEYAVCASNTYDPDDSCFRKDRAPESFTFEEQYRFLQPEWNRLLDLNRNPEEELGAHPPWLNKLAP